MTDWTPQRIDAIYELRQDGLSANEIGAVFGCSGDCVRMIARKKGFPFHRSGADIGKERANHVCMRCKVNPVEGRWQRCIKCNETVREMGSFIGVHTLRL